MNSIDDECDDWGVSMCRTASAHSVQSLELSSQRNELLRIKEFEKSTNELRLNSGSNNSRSSSCSGGCNSSNRCSSSKVSASYGLQKEPWMRSDLRVGQKPVLAI